MSAGGWNLIHTWLTDGILAKNWALIQELLELLLLCPVDIERLKNNNCPKLVKGLSKEGSHQGVRTLATRLVEQWLKIVKGEAAPNSVPAQIMTVQLNATAGQASVVPSSQQQLQQHYSINSQQTVDISENATVHVQDYKIVQQSTLQSTPANQIQQDQEKQQQKRLQPQIVQVVGKVQQGQISQQTTQQQCKKQFVVVSSQSSVPVYKITIRDGNQVLAKVETDATNISGVPNTSSTTKEVNESTAGVTLLVKQETEKTEETEQSGSVTSGQDDTVDIGHLNNSVNVSSEVKQTIVSSKDNQDIEGVKSKDNKDSKDTISDSNNKSSDKENRDSHKKDDKKSSSSSDKKSSSHHHSSSSSSKSSSKHSTSSSTHRSSSTSHKSSSHRSSSSSSKSSNKDRSSKDKDKHHSSSSSKHSSNRSKSDRDKEREKEKQKKDQAEKDKATLEKVQGQALSPRLGKIPKKRTEDEKSDANGRKSSTESRDSSKENKDKADLKKDAVATKVVTEKKNISISIENRKGSQDLATRPKTVKTFNSKFRSTGLEEEVKPPPPRSKKSNSTVDKKILPPKFPLKRPSPLREAVPLLEKRAKLSLDSPTTPPSDEKKGGIKLIPPKPKRKYIDILLQIKFFY